MSEKVIFIDTDSICGKEIVTNHTKDCVVGPTKKFITDMEAADIKVVLCCWSDKSKGTCKKINKEFNATAVEIAPPYKDKDQNFRSLYQTYNTDAKHALYVASNPTTKKKAEAAGIQTVLIKISNPLALTSEGAGSTGGQESRDQFELLKKTAHAFKLA
jgi:hypothetical protein